MHYLPLSPAFFAILVALFLVLVALIQVGILRYAYMRLGVRSGAALSLLLASLIGSYVNLPFVRPRGMRRTVIGEHRQWARRLDPHANVAQSPHREPGVGRGPDRNRLP